MPKLTALLAAAAIGLAAVANADDAGWTKVDAALNTQCEHRSDAAGKPNSSRPLPLPGPCACPLLVHLHLLSLVPLSGSRSCCSLLTFIFPLVVRLPPKQRKTQSKLPKIRRRSATKRRLRGSSRKVAAPRPPINSKRTSRTWKLLPKVLEPINAITKLWKKVRPPRGFSTSRVFT